MDLPPPASPSPPPDVPFASPSPPPPPGELPILPPPPAHTSPSPGGSPPLPPLDSSVPTPPPTDASAVPPSAFGYALPPPSVLNPLSLAMGSTDGFAVAVGAPVEVAPVEVAPPGGGSYVPAPYFVPPPKDAPIPAPIPVKARASGAFQDGAGPGVLGTGFCCMLVAAIFVSFSFILAVVALLSPWFGYSLTNAGRSVFSSSAPPAWAVSVSYYLNGMVVCPAAGDCAPAAYADVFAVNFAQSANIPPIAVPAVSISGVQNAIFPFSYQSSSYSTVNGVVTLAYAFILASLIIAGGAVVSTIVSSVSLRRSSQMGAPATHLGAIGTVVSATALVSSAFAAQLVGIACGAVAFSPQANYLAPYLSGNLNVLQLVPPATQGIAPGQGLAAGAIVCSFVALVFVALAKGHVFGALATSGPRDKELLLDALGGVCGLEVNVPPATCCC